MNEQKNIQKKNFANVIKTIKKKSLSNFDDKFYTYSVDDEVKSLPYGHYKIKTFVSEKVEEIID